MHCRRFYIILIAALISPLWLAQAQVDSILSGYDKHWELKDGLFRVMSDSRMGVVNKDGAIVVPCEFNQVWNLDENGFIRVLKSGKAGVYHKSGKVIIPAEYDQIWSFNNGWAKVMRQGKLGYFNQDGLPVVPCEYQQIWSFEEGRARVLKNGKVGYIDEQGNEIIPASYQQIWSFENGRARVLKDGKVGYIDEQGNVIVAPVYSHIWTFEEGKAKALLDGKMVWIDENGTILDLPVEQSEGDEFMAKEQPSSIEEKHIVIEDDRGDKTLIKVLGGNIIVNESGRNTYIEISSGRSKHQNSNYDKRFRGHYTGLEIGFANYVTSDGSTYLPEESSFMNLEHSASHAFAFNFIQWSIGLQRRGNIGLVTGLGVEHSRYRFSGPYILSKDDDGNTSYITSDRNIKSNRLATTYLNLPLLLEFQIPTNHHHKLYFSGGAVGGWRLHSFTRVKYNDNDGPGKEKKTSDFNLQDWRYGVMVRMGYRAINLYGSYYLSSMFETDKGPELYPVSVGLSFSFNMWDLSR